MSDSYQAIYDAVRSRIGGADVGSAVERACREAFDLGNMRNLLQEQFLCAAYEMQRPSAVYRPAIAPDGDQWCALYGENLVEGVAGFGATPSDAMAAFDHAWWKQITPAAALAAVRMEPTTQHPDGARVISTTTETDDE